jgi:hypothetical protein
MEPTRMKTALIVPLTFLLAFPAYGAEFKLVPSDDAYISLNECLYALTRGTKISTTTGEDLHVYQNQAWLISVEMDLKMLSCELAGEFIE